MYIIYFKPLPLTKIVSSLFSITNVKVAKIDTSFLAFFGIFVYIIAFLLIIMIFNNN